MCAGLGCPDAPQSGGLLSSPAFLEVSDNPAFSEEVMKAVGVRTAPEA